MIIIRACSAHNKRFRSELLNRNYKLIKSSHETFHDAGAEVWTVTSEKMNARGVFGRKIVRKPRGCIREEETGEQQQIRRYWTHYKGQTL